MTVATIALLATQSRHPAGSSDLVAVLAGKPYRVESWSTESARLLAKAKSPYIPNSWSALRSPYLPNTYRWGDVGRFPLPGAQESDNLTVRTLPPILLKSTPAAEAIRKKLTDTVRELQKRR